MKRPQRGSPVFYYDFYSPYSYLAAERVNSVLPVEPDWRPISYGHLFMRTERPPWSFHRDEEWDAHWAEIGRRAAERGLPDLRIPDGWPMHTYSIDAPRAAAFAKRSDRVVEFSLALFRQVFAHGRTLELSTVLLAAAACELDLDALVAGIQSQAVKDEVARATDEAFDRGVTGVPTIAAGGRLFWGDDQLEAAAAACRSG